MFIHGRIARNINRMIKRRTAATIIRGDHFIVLAQFLVLAVL